GPSGGGPSGGPRHLAVEPRAGGRPLPLDGGGREAEDVGRLGDRESDEVAELDDLTLAGVERGEPNQRLVEGDDLGGALGGEEAGLVERERPAAPAALLGAAAAGVVHEHLPHRLRGHTEEVGAVVRGGPPLGLPW